MSTSQDKRIGVVAKSNTHVPFTELKNTINVDVSGSIIHRHLHEDGVRKWRAVKLFTLIDKRTCMERLKVGKRA
jgi:hypothetical protein